VLLLLTSASVDASPFFGSPNDSSRTPRARLIPPAAQRAMSKRAGSSVVEVKGSHAVCVSQPEAVAELIQKAAKTLSMK